MYSMIRSVFLSGLGVIFFTAFVSYHVQFPGLNSSSGIEPAGRIFPYAFPQIYKGEWQFQTLELGGWLRLPFPFKFHNDTRVLWYEVDILCEVVSILGIFLSAIAAR